MQQSGGIRHSEGVSPKNLFRYFANAQYDTKLVHKKAGFTILEIIVLIFIISIFATITIPVVINDSKEAALISNWRMQVQDAKYFFSLIKMNNSEEVQKAFTDRNEREIFNLYLKYAGLENVEEVPLENYNLKSLNNKVIKEDSPYYIQRMIKKDDTTFIGFSPCKNCVDHEKICGKLFFDVNGMKGPNKLGVDVFGFDVRGDNLQIFGEDRDIKKVRKDCSRFGTGAYCSIYYLKGGKFY